jgi:hypothetical protein
MTVQIQFSGGGAALASGWAAEAEASAAAAAASAAAATAVPVHVDASMTISAPGYYVVTTAGITLTLNSGNGWAVLGLVKIKDMSGSPSPNITIAAMVDNVFGASIDNPKQELELTWDPAFPTWLSS